MMTSFKPQETQAQTCAAPQASDGAAKTGATMARSPSQGFLGRGVGTWDGGQMTTPLRPKA